MSAPRTIGEALKAERIAAGMSQRELAAASGGHITRAAVSRVESGQRMPARHGMAAYALALNLGFTIARAPDTDTACVWVIRPDGSCAGWWPVDA